MYPFAKNKRASFLKAEEPPITASMDRTAREMWLKSQGQNRLSKSRRAKTAICTFNARTLAPEACIEDLMMQVRRIKYDVIGLNELRRQRSLHAAFYTGEELFLGTYDGNGVYGVGVPINRQ
uniref:Endo/exonuclease/phosphatase domain-containing protein n=1 Tax=Haemonchus contortus TaxID=6289 RepID=A0A7I4Z1B5_HAECO